MVWFFWKLTCFSQKKTSPVSFIKESVVSLVTCDIISEFQWLSLVPRSAKLNDKFFERLHIRLICLNIQTSYFETNRLNFSSQGLNQQLCISRASNKHTISRNVFCIKNITDQKNERIQKFFIFPENQTFCSPNLKIFSVKVSIHNCFIVQDNSISILSFFNFSGKLW